jgi:hypothetical protein
MACPMSQRAFQLPFHEEKHKKPEKECVPHRIEIAQAASPPPIQIYRVLF